MNRIAMIRLVESPDRSTSIIGNPVRSCPKDKKLLDPSTTS